MVSDKLQALYDERAKRKNILENKPDTKWAKKELDSINSEIKDLERVEKTQPADKSSRGRVN